MIDNVSIVATILSELTVVPTESVVEIANQLHVDNGGERVRLEHKLWILFKNNRIYCHFSNSKIEKNSI
jgi:hypothetical protein